jgi:hypothetical protein
MPRIVSSTAVYLRDIVKASQQYGIQVAKNNEKVRITNQEVRHKIIKYLNEEKCMDSFDEGFNAKCIVKLANISKGNFLNSQNEHLFFKMVMCLSDKPKSYIINFCTSCKG